MTTIINGSSPSITFSDGSAQTSATQPFQNRIINGAMVIDQRNAGASVTPANADVTLDRWGSNMFPNASKYTVVRSSTAPAGFTNSLLVTSSSAYSIGATDIYTQFQWIEGFNTADLNWGSANAKTVTLSFWVRSSLTGTFGGALQNSDGTRSYPFSYTISVANTFEYKTITIAGDTSGTWLTTNGRGIGVIFGLGVGSTYSGTAGAWSGSAFYSATGATSVVGTNGATFFITGCQLEVGSTATSFDYRPFGTELALCQRYFQTIGGDVSSQFAGTGMNYATNAANIYIPLLTKMRATPTVGFSSVSDWGITYASGAQAVATGIASDQSSTVSANISVTVSGTPLTNGGASKLIAQATTAARLNFSSEL